MATRSIVPILTAILLGTASHAWSQQPQNFPDGPGKDTVVKVCGGCHDINRARAGYAPAGTCSTHDAFTPRGEWATCDLPDEEFPERQRPPAAVILARFKPH
jgi:virginiamycin B lyase